MRVIVCLVRALANDPPYVICDEPTQVQANAPRLVRERPELQKKLWSNAEHLYLALEELGFEVGPNISPVVAVRSESTETAIQWWQQLFDMGIFVNLVIPPASPAGYSLLRCSISAAHSDAEVQKIVAAYATLNK